MTDHQNNRGPLAVRQASQRATQIGIFDAVLVCTSYMHLGDQHVSIAAPHGSLSRSQADAVQVAGRICHATDPAPVLPTPRERIQRRLPTDVRPEHRDQRPQQVTAHTLGERVKALVAG